MNKYWIISLCCICLNASGQVSFTDQTSSLGFQSARSFYPVAIADLNADFLDDVVYLDSGRYMWTAIQNTGAPFSISSIGKVSMNEQWSICVGDLQHDAVNDIMVGGQQDSLKVFVQSDTSGGYVMETIDLAFYMQGSNFVDINNDGWTDIFACNDLGINYPFRNYNAGSFILDMSLITTTTDAGNYASIWSDYDNDGDLDVYISKCYGSASSPSDPRRINLLYQNDGINNFTEVGDSIGVADGAQTWAAEFADIDNDGDMDLFVLNHINSNRLYENLGDGTYSNIFASSGIVVDTSLDNFQMNFSDFDNDGYVDLLLGGAANKLFLNNGDQTFSVVANPFPGSDTITSFSVGDLNHDGFRDIYSVNGPLLSSFQYYNKPDRVLINSGNSNNYLVVNLVGIYGNTNGIGARLELYGPWGIQIRDVRSGEGYGIMNSLSRHFGLGQATQIDSLIVRWPGGTIDKVVNPQINQFLTVTEGLPVGIEEVVSDSPLVYPNPVGQRLEIEVSNEGRWSFFLEDIHGRRVVGLNGISQSSWSLDVSDLQPGIYVYQIEDLNSFQVHGKLIIQ